MWVYYAGRRPPGFIDGQGGTGRCRFPACCPPCFPMSTVNMAHSFGTARVESVDAQSDEEKCMSSDYEAPVVALPAKTSVLRTSHRRLMLRIDCRILPLFGCLYAFCLIDRINMGSARTAGMGEDLGLDRGARYSIATCLYFVPYILFQIPGNLLVRRFGVRVWLSSITIGWGAVQIGMGFVTSWGYLTLCRVLLGALEAAFFPGLVLVISTWYTRYEVQTRLAIFYLSSLAVAGFSQILAYALNLLDGRGGVRGWQWIFIVEGAVTLALGALSFWLLPEFPDRNTFLAPEETAYVLKRIEDDRGDAVPDQLTRGTVLKHLSDWTLWAYGIMFACATIPSYALAYFVSVILHGIGYSKAQALIMSAFPYLPAIATAVGFARMADRYKLRGVFIVAQALLCVTGLALMAFAKLNTVRYFGTFLATAGCSGCIPGILSYGSNNVVTQSKKNVQTALSVTFGGVGGIIAAMVFREADFPDYVPGLWVTMGAQIVLIVLVGITSMHFSRLNRLSLAGKLADPLEGRPGFLYTL
ncbi:major facilitator superfamily domain-containing protein [Schizophyllum amplum]|uniref:Major facilitator superfamily domain-containing protein n=1 Tax=Schizophyllum amplum TaxID=97359 RepID=A0A550CWE6_9AGAR|nr:major facilitator superfamily domain-containing protein [Auriculariopsis ampla]